MISFFVFCQDFFTITDPDSFILPAPDKELSVDPNSGSFLDPTVKEKVAIFSEMYI